MPKPKSISIARLWKTLSRLRAEHNEHLLVSSSRFISQAETLAREAIASLGREPHRKAIALNTARMIVETVNLFISTGVDYAELERYLRQAPKEMKISLASGLDPVRVSATLSDKEVHK